MPILDDCLTNIYEPGFLGASFGTAPVPTTLTTVTQILTADSTPWLTEDDDEVWTEG